MTLKRPRLPAIVAVTAAVFAVAALVTGLLAVTAGAGPAAAGLANSNSRPRLALAGDSRPQWAVRHAKLTAADVTHRAVMARAARELARAKARRQARAAAALAARQAAQQQTAAQQQSAAQQQAAGTTGTAAPSGGGVLSPAQIGRLWLNAGGSASTEQTAICIAEAESGGRADAVSPTDDYGVWQEHDAPQALNPSVSASMAVQMSSGGADWSQWTTAGMC